MQSKSIERDKLLCLPSFQQTKHFNVIAYIYARFLDYLHYGIWNRFRTASYVNVCGYVVFGMIVIVRCERTNQIRLLSIDPQKPLIANTYANHQTHEYFWLCI